MTNQSNALISFNEFLLFNDNYKSQAENDILIENIINYVTDEFHAYCSIPQFKSRQYTEYYNGDGSNKLFPNRNPIITVTSIYDDPDWVYDTETLIDSSLYKIVDSRYIILKESTFAESTQNIKLVYTCGYATIPNDIKLAALKEVSRTFARRYENDVTGKTLEDGSINYVEKGLLKSTKDTLNKYKRLMAY